MGFSGCVLPLNPDFLGTPEASLLGEQGIKEGGSWVILHFQRPPHRVSLENSLSRHIAELLVRTDAQTRFDSSVPSPHSQ